MSIVWWSLLMEPLHSPVCPEVLHVHVEKEFWNFNIPSLCLLQHICLASLDAIPPEPLQIHPVWLVYILLLLWVRSLLCQEEKKNWNLKNETVAYTAVNKCFVQRKLNSASLELLYLQSSLFLGSFGMCQRSQASPVCSFLITFPAEVLLFSNSCVPLTCEPINMWTWPRQLQSTRQKWKKHVLCTFPLRSVIQSFRAYEARTTCTVFPFKPPEPEASSLREEPHWKWLWAGREGSRRSGWVAGFEPRPGLFLASSQRCCQI